jgi:pimeloyl-ACP methyl ester carboxylesterase
LLAELPRWISPVVITYPEFGLSSYEDLLPVIIRVVDTLPNFFILGWSFGGPLALMVESERPEQTQGIILCVTFVHEPRPELVRWRFLIRGPVVGIVRAFRRLRLNIKVHPSNALRRAKKLTWQRVNSRQLAARARAALAVDLRPELANCSAPILYLQSSDDDVIPQHNLETILAIVPDIKHVIINGPHLALFSNPLQAADEITKFIQQNKKSP